MRGFLEDWLERSLKGIDFSKGLGKQPESAVLTANPTQDGKVFELVIDGKRYLISIEECED